MIRVTVGIHNYHGTVDMTYEQYQRELAHGGTRYMEVHCAHGIERFRVKYFRSVERVP